MNEKYEADMSVSVVIPTFNREKTIRRCIDSIVNQTYPAFEIIVVDDGSEDRTLDILQSEYKDVVKIVKQVHKGAQAARNAGILAANGEYIAFLDSDDEWLPNTLELQIEALKKDINAVVCGNGYIQREWEKGIPKVYKNGTKKATNICSRRILKMNGKSGYVYKDILKSSFCLFSTLVTSKKNLIDIQLLDEDVLSYQEWDTAIRLAKNCNFIYIRRPLFVYHLHDGVTISKDAQKGIDGFEYILEKYKYEILIQLGKKGLEQKYKYIMQMCISYRDSRIFKYLIKYVMAKQSLFIFRENESER